VLVVIALVISLFGGRNNVKRLCYLSFLLFLPSTLSFSVVDWLSFIGVKNALASFASFTQTLFSGILLLLCYLFLNYLSRIKETRKELLSRGGNATEVDSAVNNRVLCTFTVLLVSGLLSVFAALFLITGQSAATTLAKGIPYANLFIGIGSILIITLLVYYYLNQHGGKLDDLPRNIHQHALNAKEKMESEDLDIHISSASLKTYMRKKFETLITLGVTPDLADQYFKVVEELSVMGIRAIKDLNDIIPNDYIERQIRHLPTVSVKPDFYGILVDLLVIHNAETFFDKVIGDGHLVLQEPDIRFLKDYGVDLGKHMDKIQLYSSRPKKTTVE
jgi:hypothetical protein